MSGSVEHFACEWSSNWKQHLDAVQKGAWRRSISPHLGLPDTDLIVTGQAVRIAGLADQVGIDVVDKMLAVMGAIVRIV